MASIKKIIYDCRQATRLIEKRQFTTLTFKEWIHLMIHLTGCSMCRLFQHQSRVIRRLMQQLFQRSSSGQYHLDEQTKQTMQKEIDDRLS